MFAKRFQPGGFNQQCPWPLSVPWLCAFVRETELVELSSTSWSSKFSMLDLCFCTSYLSPLELSVVPGQMGGAETCI